ncbi:MAG: hypothetical protein A2901_07425 [Elusimicrobia bacterium RIFCSPLOWO2_01_FULL_54_10]|nr:MAG: hypothetical protein A2901_07425 [Elusimicrobia bacterium RIFCSPLOWO2_01_FULL_54_10]
MKKKDLVLSVSERARVSHSVANRVIKSLVKTIAGSLEAGDRITLSGLGTFRTKARKAKPARNLQTGESVYLPAGKKISFKPSLSFKRLLKTKPDADNASLN